MPTLIPREEIEFHPSSYIDANMRLFLWRGGLYRAVGAKNAQFFRGLVRSDAVKRSMQRGLLVQTEETDLSLAGFELVLRHRILPVVSYVYEWSFAAIREAALLTLELQAELLSEGLQLHDAHPWNILFDGPNPIFVDFGGIGRESASSSLHRTYVQNFVNPLRLMAAGQSRIARALLRELDHAGVRDQEVSGVVAPSTRVGLTRRAMSFARVTVPPPLRPTLKKLLGLSSAIPARSLSALRKQIESLELSAVKAKAGACENHHSLFSTAEIWTARQRSVQRVLQSVRPRSVVDIESADGCFSKLAARMNAKVVAFDTDEARVNDLYREAKRDNLDIQPLVMNIYAPSGGTGFYNRIYPSATERLRSEMAIALNLVHELSFEGYLSLDHVVDCLADFAERWLLVEFVPKEDAAVTQEWKHEYDWYNLENFRRALTAKFSKVVEYPSAPEGRVLLLCHRER